MAAVPRAVADFSPSQKLVAIVLQRDEWLTVNDVVARTHMDRTTVYYALDELYEGDLLERRPSCEHPNATEFRLSLQCGFGGPHD
jgi:DNA-binding MarR family transcriptional regulator